MINHVLGNVHTILRSTHYVLSSY